MTGSDTQEIDLNALRRLALENLGLLGLTEKESEIVANVLLYAELRDKSQGLIKILEETVVPAPDRTAVEVESRSPAIHLLHANGHAGMVVLNQATEVTIDACAQVGLALTGTRGTASSTGSIGYYAERIAQAGFIGIVMAGSPKVMATAGSRLPAMGTNPLAISVPAASQPLVFDMATAATTWFDLVHHSRSNTPIAPGLALDRDGEPTTNASEALRGVMLTFGGSKGSGLALMLEMLTGPLMGASLVGDKHDSRGNFLLAIDPSLLIDDFAQRAERVIDSIRRGPRQKGCDAIRLPGEHSSALAHSRISAGKMPINRDILQKLQEKLRV